MVACKYPQVRNYETGRCKAPCKAHQARNPANGNCVTKTFLKALHIRGDLGTSEYRAALRDDGITRRDGRSRRSGGPVSRSAPRSTRFEFDKYGDFDFTEFDYKEPKTRKSYGKSYGKDSERDLRDMLVYDKRCHPRKLNLATGKCRKPCDPGYAINYRNGRCVTIEHLLKLDMEEYVEDEDDDMAENIKWYPSTVQTTANHTDAEMKKLINNSKLTVADLKVMSGIEMAGSNSDHSVILGIYSHGQRKACDESLVKSLASDKLKKCGMRRVTFPTQEDAAGKFVDTIVVAEADFVFLYDSDTKFGSGFLSYFLGEITNMEINVRLALVEGHGVWRIVCSRAVKKFQDVPTQEQMNKYGRKQLAEELDKYYENQVSFSYHPFDAQTRY